MKKCVNNTTDPSTISTLEQLCEQNLISWNSGNGPSFFCGICSKTLAFQNGREGSILRHIFGKEYKKFFKGEVTVNKFKSKHTDIFKIKKDTAGVNALVAAAPLNSSNNKRRKMEVFPDVFPGMAHGQMPEYRNNEPVSMIQRNNFVLNPNPADPDPSYDPFDAHTADGR